MVARGAVVSHYRLCIARVVLSGPAGLREDLVRNPSLEGLALWLLRPTHEVIEAGLIDINGLALVVVLRVGWWSVQHTDRPQTWPE